MQLADSSPEGQEFARRRGRSRSEELGRRHRSPSPDNAARSDLARGDFAKKGKKKGRSGGISPSPSPPRRAEARDGESVLSRGDRMARVLQKEREAASTFSSDYARRPTGYKEALALKMDKYTSRKRSKSPPRREVDPLSLHALKDKARDVARDQSRSPPPDRPRDRSRDRERSRRDRDADGGRDRGKDRDRDRRSSSRDRKRRDRSRDRDRRRH